MQPRQAQASNAGFYLVLASLLFEFGRPQSLIPGLKLIPFATGLDVLLLLSVVMSGKLNFSRLQTKLWIPLFVVMAIHVPIARNNYWALMTFKDMLLIFGLYLGIVTYVNSLEKMLTLMKVWMGILCFLAVMGISKGGKGIGGWLGDENDFCMVMNMAVPFGYFLLFSTTNVAQKMKYLGFLGIVHFSGYGKSFAGRLLRVGLGGNLLLVPLAQEAECFHRGCCSGSIYAGACSSNLLGTEIGSSTDEETMKWGTGAARLYSGALERRCFSIILLSELGRKITRGRSKCMKPA